MSVRTFTSMPAAIALAAGATAAISTVAATPASADSCYTWQRTLKRGHQGPDVKQLQIRVAGWVAGWVATDFQVAVDGVFGAKTERAVKRFQRGYGLPVTGRADSATYRKIYRLQDADCTPVHFSYSEFNYNCGARNFEGGNVSARQARANALRVMWQLAALRHKLGDRALVVTSGFRSIACNRSVGGSPTSLHTYARRAIWDCAAGRRSARSLAPPAPRGSTRSSAPATQGTTITCTSYHAP